MRHRLSASVHGINFLGFLIHQEASFWTFPDVSASDLNVMLGAARLSGIVHQSTTSLSYLSLGIYGIIPRLGQTHIFFFLSLPDILSISVQNQMWNWFEYWIDRFQGDM